MKIIEDIQIITKNYGSVATLMGEPRTHLGDKPISRLLKLLEAKGVNIDEKDSRKDLKLYGDSEEPIKVSLNTSIPRSSPIAYYLKGDVENFTELEIELKDYYNDWGGTNLDGGSFHVEHGIKGQIIFKGSYEQGAIVSTIKEAIEEFYNPFSDLKV